MATRRHPTHPAHPLYWVIPPYEHGWKCDSCATSGGKTHVWHCEPCGYDLCTTCVRTEAQAPLSSVGDFNESAFTTRVNAAVERVRLILENTRNPTFASDVHHEYEDKFLLAEYIGNTTVAAILQTFEALGLNEKIFHQLKEWSAKRSVALRLKSEETCKFVRKATREQESDTKYVSNSTLFGKSESYSVTKITEWFWAFDVKYELIAYMGNEPEKGLIICGRAGSLELKTTTEVTPRPASVVRPNIDLNISWLLSQLEASSRTAKFSIDRRAKSCHTPRRNAEVDSGLGFLTSLFAWCNAVYTYLYHNIWSLDADHGCDLTAIKDSSIFVPCVPLFDPSFKKQGGGVVPVAYIGPFLAEQKRTLADKFGELNTVFPPNNKLVTAAEARILVSVLHLQKLCASFGEGVDSIENMLHRQLVAAIGKEVNPLDFAHYMRFHSRKLFRGEYAPLPFSFAIRRVGHDPEGTLSIEATPSDGSVAEPITTIVRHTTHARQMKFALDASTEVRFGGDRYLHGYIAHQFGGESAATISLRARARQFSSYIVLVGSIASADLFMPKFGIIVKNKDEIKIPLNFDTIPTPKEFKDAIESLSPEQQRFAKAFRGMQLESTLFGVCVIQIKPQLERLLNLPPDALTKEIQLAEDLQSLFIEYQMPSDLLSFDGQANSSIDSKVARVKELCATMMGTIQKEKDEQLKQAKMAQELRAAEEDRLRAERQRVDETRFRTRDEGKVVMMERQSSSKGGFLSALANTVRGAVSPRRMESSSAPSYDNPLFTSSSSASNALYSADAAPEKMMDFERAAESEPAPKDASAPEVGGAAAPAPADGKPKIEAPKDLVKQKEQQEIVEAIAEDYTKVPQELERKFEQLDDDSALRPTIITAGHVWNKRYQKSLLASPETTSLGKDEQGKERNRAFDLLDALTKSGAMPIAEVDLHVVIAATHCFEKSVMMTVVQDNVNPIEKVERSALIVATTVHQRTAQQLIQEEQVQRVATYSPKLIENMPAGIAAAPLLSSAALQPLAKK